ncbi:MAG: hypothetical protein V2A75_05250 [Pseudomonadota bacterium]
MLLLNLFLPIALFVEAHALMTLFRGGDAEGLNTYFVFHFLASIFMTFFQLQYVPKNYTKETKQMGIFFLIVNFSTLTFGFIVTMVVIFFGLRKMILTQEDINTDKISFNQITDAYPEIKRIFGEGSLEDTLNSEHAHSKIKIKALSALYNTKNPEAMKHIKNALSDDSDEVRLYSFSLIDNFEKELNKKIHLALLELQNELDEVTQGAIYGKLAFLYWDMLYYEISDSNLKNYFMTRVQNMIDASFKLAQNDGSLYVLQGRLLLLNGKTQEAESSFKDALNAGAKVKVISTYLAEIAFLKKDFTQVAYWLNQYPNLCLDLKMYSNYQLWTGKK